ncbi:hypothetical protein EI94DRAFT_1891708 [Lactarius quietus]|nr:hypothetical protein EI94DRAFT_1891708 [Lactarius quietus]
MPDVESQSSGVTMDELTSTTQSPQLPQRVAIAADQQGEKYEDSSDGVWSMYLTEAKKQDRDVIESWKGDTEGILFFTGLFSATVRSSLSKAIRNYLPIPVILPMLSLLK